ncbi:MAG TPA: FHA domain-containing protein [Planctomycetota bacterium]|nr:FHA domain-containing protein [Planctomycetota bacterium]
MPKLEILSGKREGDVVDLPADGLDIGNRKNARLSIRDPWISWNHAKIICEEGRFIIEDLGSSNGTQVNGRKITRQPLQPQDEILLGKTRIRFVEASSGAPSIAPPPAFSASSSDDNSPSQTMRLSRSDMAMAVASAQGGQLAALERERDELKRMKEVLEKFLDLSPEERSALARSSSGPAAAPSSGVDADAAEKARQEAVAKVIALEGKLAEAESRAVDAENRAKAAAEDKKKEVARLKTKHDEELATLKLQMADAENARAKAEEKAADLAKKVETAAASANERADRIQKELETARKSAIDAEARASKLEQNLDAARRATGRLSASGQDGNPELDSIKVELAQAKAERDDWQRKHEETRAEIDRISMEQIELEDQLRKQIAELEAELKKTKGS